MTKMFGSASLPSVLASAFLATSSMIALGAAPVEAATPRNALVVGTTIDDTITMDPHEIFEFSAAQYLNQVYERLVTFDPQNIGPIVGGVAERWTVSPDGKTFTFKIRKGLKFHSGNPITAADVEYSLHRLITLNKSPAFILGQFGLDKDNVKTKVKAVDADTVTLETDKAYATTFVLNCLTAGAGSVVDSKLLKEKEVNGDWGAEWLKTNSAGSGPFKLVRWEPNKAITLESNETYWGGAPQMKRAIMQHIPEASARRLALEKGDVDVVTPLDNDNIKGLAGNKDVRTTYSPVGTIWYLGLNTKNPTLAKPQVQQALKYLVDYEGMANTFLAGRFKVHQTYIPEGFLGAISDKPYKLDIAKAKQLLTEAGVPDGFKVTMDVRSVSPTKDMAEAIQANFAKVGIQLEIIPGDGRQTLTKYRARQHDIYIGQWGADFLDPHSNADTFAKNEDNSDGAKAKPLAWRNAWDPGPLTKATLDAMTERDGAKRAAMYADAQRSFLNNSPFVIMFQEIVPTVSRTNVDGYIQGPSFDLVYYRFVSKK